MIFAVVAALLSLLLITVAEGVFRLIGYGGYPPILREIGPVDGGTLVITNPPGAASYCVAGRESPGQISPYAFVNPKPKGKVRVMLFGGSAMKGYPQTKAFRCGRLLRWCANRWG